MQDLLRVDGGHVVHEHGDQGLASLLIERATEEGVRQVLDQVLVAEGTLRGGVGRKSVNPFFDWKKEMDKFPQE